MKMIKDKHVKKLVKVTKATREFAKEHGLDKPSPHIKTTKLTPKEEVIADLIAVLVQLKDLHKEIGYDGTGRVMRREANITRLERAIALMRDGVI